MARLILAAALLLPVAAFAQSTQSTQPITLSAAEYEALVTQLASRDPLIHALMQKQAEAQQKALADAAAKPQPAQ